MICDDIKHNPNISSMTFLYKINEILLSTEIHIQIKNSSCPITMISSIIIVNNRGNPNSIKTKIYNNLNKSIYLKYNLIDFTILNNFHHNMK